MSEQSVFIELPSVSMQRIYKIIREVGRSKIPFFITGETGVGKEGMARYIHENGPRRDQPFIPINCGRLPAELLQSELFGHEAGAFTSTIHQRHGAYESESNPACGCTETYTAILNSTESRSIVGY